MFLSSDFIAKNQLAREGSQSVSPVTIPALTTIVDRQFKEDRTLCPVRALRYYLDRTKDLRGSHSLLSDASRVRDTRYLASFSTSPQFGIFGAFGRRRDPACLQKIR